MPDKDISLPRALPAQPKLPLNPFELARQHALAQAAQFDQQSPRCQNDLGAPNSAGFFSGHAPSTTTTSDLLANISRYPTLGQLLSDIPLNSNGIGGSLLSGGGLSGFQLGQDNWMAAFSNSSSDASVPTLSALPPLPSPLFPVPRHLHAEKTEEMIRTLIREAEEQQNPLVHTGSLLNGSLQKNEHITKGRLIESSAFTDYGDGGTAGGSSRKRLAALRSSGLAAVAEEINPSKKQRTTTDDQPQPAQKTCKRCGTHEAPIWRRVYNYELCNACGLYVKRMGEQAIHDGGKNTTTRGRPRKFPVKPSTPIKSK